MTGVIKVADLGLVKIPDVTDGDLDGRGAAVSGMASGTQVTMLGTAVGTPAYMAPEQGIDAATVDHRADIYSLGCSLYCMLTGHPPFDGTDVSEVMQQHATQPFPLLTQTNSRVPQSLQRVVARATAKRPSDRYGSISDMIQELEDFLGVRTDGGFSPTKQQADSWDSIAAAYHQANAPMRIARVAIMVWATACLLLTIMIPMLYLKGWMFGPSMFAAAIATAAILAAQGGKSAAMSRFRAWLGSMVWTDRGIGLVGTLLGLVVVVMLGWWPALLAGMLGGIVTASVYHFAWVVPSRNASAASRQQAERFVRDLRIEGADEQGLRTFIAHYSGGQQGGKAWQAIFEDLFGYDALCQTRERLASDPTFPDSMTSLSLRDRVLQWLATRTQANLDARDRVRLAGIEERGLASEGLSPAEARERAWQIAAAIMEQTRSNQLPVKVASSRGTDTAAEAQAAHEKRIRMKAMLADARSGRYRKQRDKLSPLKVAFSGQTRLLVGLLLLAWFAVKGHQEGIFEALKNLDTVPANLDQIGSVIREATTGDATLTEDAKASHASTWSLGFAGLFMAMSSFVSGWRMTPFAVVATIVILLGPLLGIPAAGPLPAWIVSIGVALLIYVPGIVFGESRDEPLN